MIKFLSRLFLLVLVLCFCFAVQALAQATAAPAGSAPLGIGGWIGANWQLVIAPLVVAIIDFVWALSPSASSNGLLHWLWTAAGGKTPTQPPS